MRKVGREGHWCTCANRKNEDYYCWVDMSHVISRTVRYRPSGAPDEHIRSIHPVLWTLFIVHALFISRYRVMSVAVNEPKQKKSITTSDAMKNYCPFTMNQTDISLNGKSIQFINWFGPPTDWPELTICSNFSFHDLRARDADIWIGMVISVDMVSRWS